MTTSEKPFLSVCLCLCWPGLCCAENTYLSTDFIYPRMRYSLLPSVHGLPTGEQMANQAAGRLNHRKLPFCIKKTIENYCSFDHLQTYKMALPFVLIFSSVVSNVCAWHCRGTRSIKTPFPVEGFMLHQESATVTPGIRSSPSQAFVWIYWNTATTIRLLIVWDDFPATRVE